MLFSRTEHLLKMQVLMSHRGHRGRRERVALLFQSRSKAAQNKTLCDEISHKGRKRLHRKKSPNNRKSSLNNRNNLTAPPFAAITRSLAKSVHQVYGKCLLLCNASFSKQITRQYETHHPQSRIIPYVYSCLPDNPFCTSLARLDHNGLRENPHR